MAMNIYAMPGDRICLVRPWNGHKSDIDRVNHYLTEGAIYTVDHVEPDTQSTCVYLREIPGIPFNSVHFEDVEKPKYTPISWSDLSRLLRSIPHDNLMKETGHIEECKDERLLKVFRYYYEYVIHYRFWLRRSGWNGDADRLYRVDEQSPYAVMREKNLSERCKDAALTCLRDRHRKFGHYIVSDLEPME